MPVFPCSPDWLRGLFDLVVIFEPCSFSAGCSKGHWIGIVVTSTLLTRSGAHDFTYFVIWRSCSTMTMRSNRPLSADSYLDTKSSELYLTAIKWSNSFLTDVTYVLLLRAIMLKNNVGYKMCLCHFMPHIELQNFLNARRSLLCWTLYSTRYSKSVRLYVCLSHAGTVSIWFMLRSWGLFPDG